MSLLLASLALAASPADCHKTFTKPMASRALYAAYAGQRRITPRDRLALSRFIRCQRRPSDRRTLHSQWAGAITARSESQMLGPVTASWYQDGGQTACGFHATYGFASLTLPCGARIRMRGPSGVVVTATMQDRGPYVTGRTYDLSPVLKAALGCGDICSVTYSP